jgi:UDP-N-acetyl-D-galactosamine dehydrogenase
MGKFIAEQTVKKIINMGGHVKSAKVNVLGATFKENCADIRNTKVVDIIHELESYGIKVFVHDPRADTDEMHHEYGITLSTWDSLPQAEAIVMAVAHNEYVNMDMSLLLSKVVKTGCFIDVKSKFSRDTLEAKGLNVWRL